MENGIVVQLRGLEREKARLDALLAADPNWRVYQNYVSQFPEKAESA